MLKGGDSGKVVVPNHSGDSLLLKLASHQETPMMPPKRTTSVGRLRPGPGGNWDLLKLWIDQGAKGGGPWRRARSPGSRCRRA